MNLVIQALLLVIGFVLLIKGADWFVEGASNVADRFGIPQLIIGLTIVALGTSAPEAAVSISAAMKGSAELTIGNVMGSNIMNILVILGLTSVICAIPIGKSTLCFDIPFIIFTTGLIVVLGLMDNVVSRPEGIILVLCMVAYITYLLIATKKGIISADDEVAIDKSKPIWKLLLSIVIGAVMIVFGSDVTVDAATEIAKIFGMSERLIGLTIVAFGTSLPELVTSVTAARKGKSEIAIGNIVGSNIFNVVFVAGITAVIIPVTYSAGFMVDSFFAVGAAVLLLILSIPKKKLTRAGGAIMLLSYAAYFVYLIKG